MYTYIFGYQIDKLPGLPTFWPFFKLHLWNSAIRAYSKLLPRKISFQDLIPSLSPPESLPLFIILIGVSSGIIIFALFTTMVAVCHRRRRQAAPGLSKKPDVTVTGTDLFKDSDRSSNISDLKPQLNGDGGYELVSGVFLYFTSCFF